MAKTLVIGVHGFNTDGEYIKELAPYFKKAGFDYQSFIYGKAAITSLGNVIANRFRTKRIYNELARKVIDSNASEVILVGHSHGLRLSWGVQKICNNVVGVVGFNGALDTHTYIDDGKNLFGVPQRKKVPIKFRSWVINCYCPTDYILKVGAKLRPCSRWGCFGAVENECAENLNLAKYGVKGHSDFLNHLPSIMPEVIKRINNKLSCS